MTLGMLLWAALAAGLAYRLYPLALGPEAIARTFVTEDGYLLLTVARNLALGHGLAISDGRILTNGVQPLATFLYALPYLVAEGDKIAGLVGVQALSALSAVLGGCAVHAFARSVLSDTEPAGPWALLVAALWFLGPLLVLHSMNGLETGLYMLMVLGAVLWFMRLGAHPAPVALRHRLAFGAFLGLVFLARNDAAFLVGALLLVRFVQLAAARGGGLRPALADTVPAGLASLAVAVPWLGYNLWLFGSIVPISGIAQSMTATLGQNLDLVPAKLFETMLPMLPIPGALETRPAVQLAAAAALTLVMAPFLWAMARRGDAVGRAVLAYALYAGLLAAHYALFFGAGHFLARYFAPLAPLMITGAVHTGLRLARLLRGRGGVAARGAGLTGVAISLALLARLTLPGTNEQGHFQVVDWVRANVAESTWVGAIQSGTLGYWHDRTINLDGKVNPHALRARRQQGTVLRYVVDSEISYLVDWPGIASWAARGAGGFDRSFELVLVDREAGLAVLHRRAEGAR